MKKALIAVFLFLSAIIAGAQSIGPRCTITPNAPVGVPAGGSTSFSASNCGNGPLTWSVIGAGSITPNGTYYAPPSVRAQNQSRGCQELPNTAGPNIPVDQLPVDPHSRRWLDRIATSGTQYPSYHNLKPFAGYASLYQNVVGPNTPQQQMHFIYPDRSNGYQDSYFPWPGVRDILTEMGTSIDMSAGWDNHLFTVNPYIPSCEETEIYQFYFDFITTSFTPGTLTQVSWTTHTVWPMPKYYQVVISGGTGTWSAANGTWRITPTGPNSGTLPFDSSRWGAPNSGLTMASTANGCPNCNSAGGQKFHWNSYAQLGGTDAASMPVAALSLKLEEWFAATRAGRLDLGHAVRTTMGNWYLSARNIWPAAGYALYQDAILSATNGANPTFTVQSDINELYYAPCANYTWTAGCHFHVVFFGLTGPWAAANGDQEAVMVDATHFTVPALDTTGWGSFHSGYSVYLVPDFMPYGATIRLSASFDVDNFCTSTDLDDWCPYAKVYLRTLQKYGMIVADGTVPSDNWDNGDLFSEFRPHQLIDATTHIRQASSLQPIEPWLEVVNRSSQQISSDLRSYMVSNTNRVTVKACGSTGCAYNDVILQGTTIGTDRERLTIAAGVSYPLNVWVNGNVNPAVSYSIDSGIIGAHVSSSGVVTMPYCPVKQRGMITVTSVSDPDALPLYIEVACLPRSADGAYRLALGNYDGDYVDSTGKTWWGNWQRGPFNNGYETIGAWGTTQNGTWQGFNPCSADTWSGVDSQLYSRSTDWNNDTRVEIIVANGSYDVTLYGEPGFGGFGRWYGGSTCGNVAGENVYDWTINGQVYASWVDGYVQAGNQPYRGYTLSTSGVSILDHLFSTTGRIRATSWYGMSWSSLIIKPHVCAHASPTPFCN